MGIPGTWLSLSLAGPWPSGVAALEPVNSAKSLVKEVLLSMEIAKYHFKEAPEQQIRRVGLNPALITNQLAA